MIIQADPMESQVSLNVEERDRRVQSDAMFEELPPLLLALKIGKSQQPRNLGSL